MHPVIKYAFAALLLLGATLHNTANAETGSFWETATQCGKKGYGYDPASAALDWDADGNATRTLTYYGDASDGYLYCSGGTGCLQYSSCALTTINVYFKTTTCPSSMQYVDQNGACTSQQPIQCEAGSKNIFVRYTFAESQQEGFYNNQAQIQNEGCIYDSIGIEECGVYPDGVKACLYEYTQTDTPAQGTESQPEEFTEGTSPEMSSSDDTGQTTFTEDPPITNPDGSTTQTTTETTTNTSGSGTEIWNDDDFIYVRDSSGTTTVYSRQNTKTTNTDGSVDETVVTTKSTQTPSTTTTTYNKNTGNVTTTNNTQSTTHNTTTTTNNYYDSEGNLTGSDSTTTGGSETENEGDENKEGNCGAPGQPACDVSLEGEDNLQDPTGILDNSILPKLDEIVTKLEEVGDTDISSDLVEFNPLNLYEGGTCDPNTFSTTYHSEAFRPLEGFCSFYDAQIRPILAFFFYCLTAWALYMIYASTMRRT